MPTGRVTAEELRQWCATRGIAPPRPGTGRTCSHPTDRPPGRRGTLRGEWAAVQRGEGHREWNCRMVAAGYARPGPGWPTVAAYCAAVAVVGLLVAGPAWTIAAAAAAGIVLAAAPWQRHVHRVTPTEKYGGWVRQHCRQCGFEATWCTATAHDGIPIPAGWPPHRWHPFCVHPDQQDPDPGPGLEPRHRAPRQDPAQEDPA